MLINIKSPVTHRIYRADLKKKIPISQKQIRESINAADAYIVHCRGSVEQPTKVAGF